MIEPLFQVRMGDGNDPRIRLTGAEGQGEAHRGGTPDHYSFGRIVPIPEQSEPPAFGHGERRPHSRSRGRLGGIGDDTKTTTAGRSHHHDLFDGVMSAQRVGGPDCGVPAGEDAYLHEGSTGFQAESGITTSIAPANDRKAAMAPRMMMGESRFTGAVYGPLGSCPSSGDPTFIYPS